MFDYDGREKEKGERRIREGREEEKNRREEQKRENERRGERKEQKREGKFGLVYFFNGISTPYGLFNAKISFLSTCLIVIITIFTALHCSFLFFYNNLFAHILVPKKVQLSKW